MSLSPLYPSATSDLHVSIVTKSSTRLSSGFDNLRYRSPSFGSQQVCSRRSPRRNRPVVPGTAMAAPFPRITFIARVTVTWSCTRTPVELLGPCFKTGRARPQRRHHKDRSTWAHAALVTRPGRGGGTGPRGAPPYNPPRHRTVHGHSTWGVHDATYGLLDESASLRRGGVAQPPKGQRGVPAF